jgi:hypothetical protein
MFRAWLILQGKTVFEAALTDSSKVLKVVPAGLSTQADQLLSCARIAFENRTGKPMSERVSHVRKLEGREWSEDTVENLYPAIHRHYKNQ